MGAGLLGGAEHAGGFHHIVGAAFAPLDVGRVLLGIHADGLAVDDQLAVLSLDAAVEFAVDGVIFHHVHHVVEIDKGIVDAHDLEFLGLGNSRAENQTADAAKTVDAYFNSHEITSIRLFLFHFNAFAPTFQEVCHLFNQMFTLL